jgi:drug/metabolite transporter (DMT)-like permease
LLAAALALCSSVAWGGADFFGGLVSRRRAVLAVLVVSQATGLALIAAILAVRGYDPGAGLRLLFAAAAGMVGAMALTAFYRGLAIGAMGVVAPISGTSAALPVIVGVVSGERPSPLQWAGIALALLGIVLLARETPGEHGTRERGGAPLAAGVGLALAAALGFGGFLTLIGEAARPDPLLATFVSRAASVGLLAIALVAVRPALSLGRRDGAIVMAIGCADLTANALYAVATTQGLLSVVAVLGSLYPVVPVVLARLVLHERLGPMQRLGAVLAIAGAGALAAG